MYVQYVNEQRRTYPQVEQTEGPWLTLAPQQPASQQAAAAKAKAQVHMCYGMVLAEEVLVRIECLWPLGVGLPSSAGLCLCIVAEVAGAIPRVGGT